MKVTSFDEKYHQVPEVQGLRELILFPGCDRKIPNSSVWVVSPHQFYMPEILGDDVGCGIVCFITEELDPKQAADAAYDHLKKQNVLGRGNHFVDFCSPLETYVMETEPHNLMLIHTDGKSQDPSIPKNFREAEKKTKKAEEFRQGLGETLLDKIGVKGKLMGDWTHNSIEQTDEHAIYRKGAIKTKHRKIHPLPANLGEKIWFYTVTQDNMPPHNSMPHGTGRAGPTSKLKVAPEEAAKLRKRIYIPEGISDSSLRPEHPSCYNNLENTMDRLREYTHSIGECTIRSYVGHV